MTHSLSLELTEYPTMYEQNIVPNKLNVTRDAAMQRDVDFFCKHGYLVIDDALSAEQLATLREAFSTLFELSGGETEALRQQLLDVDRRFHFLLDHEPVMSRIEAILGTCVQLHSACAQIARPGALDQAWHRDGPWPMDPLGTPYGSLPGQINCAYYLDSLTEATGPIRVVPGSHRANAAPPEGHGALPGEVAVYAQPRQAVLFDGWLWHRRGNNTSSQDRRVCLMCYQNAWMKSRDPFDGPLVKEMIEQGTPRRRLLLGQVRSW